MAQVVTKDFKGLKVHQQLVTPQGVAGLSAVPSLSAATHLPGPTEAECQAGTLPTQVIRPLFPKRTCLLFALGPLCRQEEKGFYIPASQ